MKTEKKVAPATTKQKSIIKYEALEESFKAKKQVYYTIEVEPDIKFFIKPIERVTLKKISSLIDTQSMKAVQVIIEDCFLGGDRDVFDDGSVFLSCIENIMSLINTKEIKVEREAKNFVVSILPEKKKDKTYRCVLKPMDMLTISTVFGRYDKGDIFGAFEILLDKCWLEGDEEIKTDNTLFLSAMGVVNTMVESKVSRLKKN